MMCMGSNHEDRVYTEVRNRILTLWNILSGEIERSK